MADVDPYFYDRADAVIELANAQLAGAARGPVNDALLYATARFNAWSSACDTGSAELMAAAKADTLARLAAQYRAVLEQQLDDYIANFGVYLKSPQR